MMKEYIIVNESNDIQKELDTIINKKYEDEDDKLIAKALKHILTMQNSIYLTLNYKGGLL